MPGTTSVTAAYSAATVDRPVPVVVSARWAGLLLRLLTSLPGRPRGRHGSRPSRRGAAPRPLPLLRRGPRRRRGRCRRPRTGGGAAASSPVGARGWSGRRGRCAGGRRCRASGRGGRSWQVLGWSGRQHCAEPGQCPSGAGPARGLADAEQLGGARDGQVLPVAQHQHRPVVRRQAAQAASRSSRLPRFGPSAAASGTLPPDAPRTGAAGGGTGTSASAPCGCRRAGCQQRRPSARRRTPWRTSLGQVLGQVVVAAQQQGGPVDAVSLRVHELLEGVRVGRQGLPGPRLLELLDGHTP